MTLVTSDPLEITDVLPTFPIIAGARRLAGLNPMMRTSLFALIFAVSAGAAFADPPARVEGMEVREGGQTIGRVADVVRDDSGRVVSAAVTVAAPDDAPPSVMAPRPRSAPAVIVAEAQGLQEPDDAPRAASGHAR